MQNYINLMTRLTTKLANMTTPRGDRTNTCYGTFILAMDRSLGFGSTPSNYSSYRD